MKLFMLLPIFIFGIVGCNNPSAHNSENPSENQGESQDSQVGFASPESIRDTLVEALRKNDKSVIKRILPPPEMLKNMVKKSYDEQIKSAREKSDAQESEKAVSKADQWRQNSHMMIDKLPEMVSEGWETFIEENSAFDWSKLEVIDSKVQKRQVGKMEVASISIEFKTGEIKSEMRIDGFATQNGRWYFFGFEEELFVPFVISKDKGASPSKSQAKEKSSSGDK